MSNLKRIRENSGLSQSQLANKSGIGIKVIQSYEQRFRDINKAQAITLYKLAQALECTIEDLLEFDLIMDDLNKPADPDMAVKLRKHFEQIKKEVEE